MEPCVTSSSKAPASHPSRVAATAADRGVHDVIGQVEVKGAMGKEERAFDDLMAKARTMNADLLINIKYDHGEGGEGEGSKMTATAVKFRSR